MEKVFTSIQMEPNFRERIRKESAKGKAFSDGLTAEASKGITSRDRFPEKLSSTFQEAADTKACSKMV